MDNNLINIDDLFRQGLGDRQDPIRAGAWSRMESLLEKEDRRKPFGFYWKRAMTYCGVAMLMAAISAGGYEGLSAYRAHGVAGNNAQPSGNPLASATGANTPAGNVAANNNGTTSATSQASHSGNSNTASVHTPTGVGDNGNTSSSATNTAQSLTQQAVANSAGSHVSSGTGHKTTGHHTTANTAVAHTGNTNTANDAVASNTAAHDDLGRLYASANGAKIVDDHIVNHKNTSADVAATTALPAATHHTNTTTHTNTPAHASTASVADNNSNHPLLPANDHRIDNGHGSAFVSLTKAPLASSTGKPKPVTVKPLTVPANTTNTTIAAKAVANNVPMVTKPIPGKRILQRIVMQETTIGKTASGIAEKRLDTISMDHITLDLTKTKTNTANTASATVAGNKPGTSKTGTGNNNSATGNNKGSNVATTPVATNNYGAKHSTTGTTPATTAVANNATTTNSKAGSTTTENNAGAAANNTDATTQGNTASEVALNAAPADQPAALIPNAAPPSAAAVPAPAATEAKQVSIAKKKHGSNMADALSSMFNQIKYKVGGIQFAPGLTAGINGTFFGPNSFKGFQFGLTGNFEMDDQWSFMAELKYFHRLNNDYSMDAVYNKYTPTTGGYLQYDTKRSYSFSTLHSFELPVTIKYTAGKFGFFAGGNFVYTLAVDAGGGPEELVDPTKAPVLTTTNTVNATPAITDADFGARFGIGYIVGLSCKVSPNVMLDFRSAQTVWDNAKAQGSQTVSNQLYKSPSLQFSIIYRLGAGKGSNKD